MGSRFDRLVDSPSEITANPPVSLEIEQPDLELDPLEAEHRAAPVVRISEMPEQFWDVTIDEVLAIGLANSKVLRSAGGRILGNPEAEPSFYDPAIQESDPIFGAQAALAAFDARTNATLLFAKNHDVFNNPFQAGDIPNQNNLPTEVRQDLATWDWTIEKTTATGAQFSWNSGLRHDNSDARALVFPSAWTAVVEGTIRQPLMQGRGLEFNRIAGPNAQPGFRTSSGILISRVNQDISIAQFELNVRQYVVELLNAYWELHFAYRNYQTAKNARETAADTWRIIRTRFEHDLPGGEADREAQTREQFFAFDFQLESALNGDERRGIVGVLQAEANLRRLMGLPQSSDRFIRPADEPLSARCSYDWSELLATALDRREDLNAQRWRIKRRELEYVAAKNFLMPRFDALFTYRNNGFGDGLFGGADQFSSAANDYFTFDHSEWQAGFEFSSTLGFRQAFAAVRNAELLLMRDRAVLEEQQQQVTFDLGTALRQAERAFNAMHIAYNRLIAARQTVESRTAAFEADTVAADLLLDAQQRLAEAETEYYRSQIDYAVAQVRVQSESGTLLALHGVNLAEEPNTICGSGDSRRRWQAARDKAMSYQLACPGYIAK